MADPEMESNFMPTDSKTIAESVQQLTDSILKLSTALLIVPVVFLRFVAKSDELLTQKLCGESTL